MATPPFKYQPMFEKGKDTTEYYLLTKDYVSVSEFEGNPILKIEKSEPSTPLFSPYLLMASA